MTRGEAAVGAFCLLGEMLLLVRPRAVAALAPHDPTAISADTGAGPSSAHLLGTDTAGRDILSRVLAGGPTVIVLPLIAVVIALVVATAVAVVSGYLGGATDQVATRVFDVILASRACCWRCS